MKRTTMWKESVIMNNDELTKAIYEFYRDHKSACDQTYKKATAPNISCIYEDGGQLLLSPRLNELAKVSIVILTANKFEKNILHQEIYKKTNIKILSFTIELFESPKKHNITDAYLFEWNGYTIFHIGCRVTGSYTLGGCADAIRYCINSPYIFPTAFVSFGICFGCREEKDHLCDTVISRKVYPYFIGAKIDGQKLKTNDDYMLSITSELENSIDRLEDLNVFKKQEFDFNVSFQNYITGEAVISSKQFRDYFIGITTQEIYAGDMEAYSLFKECYNAYRSIPCVVVISICDWGIVKNIYNPEIYSTVMKREDSEKKIKSIKDRLQALATAHSFMVMDTLLDKKVFEQSIYMRIKSKFLAEKHEHLWTRTRIYEEATNLNQEIRSLLANEYVDMLCKSFVQEGIAKVDNGKTFITKRQGDE